MRAIFGVLGLLIVVLVIGLLAKKQLSSVTAPPVVPAGLAVPGVSQAAPGVAPVSPQQQVEQFKQAVEGLQQARPVPDDPK